MEAEPAGRLCPANARDKGALQFGPYLVPSTCRRTKIAVRSTNDGARGGHFGDNQPRSGVGTYLGYLVSVTPITAHVLCTYLQWALLACDGQNRPKQAQTGPNRYTRKTEAETPKWDPPANLNGSLPALAPTNLVCLSLLLPEYKHTSTSRYVCTYVLVVDGVMVLQQPTRVMVHADTDLLFLAFAAPYQPAFFLCQVRALVCSSLSPSLRLPNMATQPRHAALPTPSHNSQALTALKAHAPQNKERKKETSPAHASIASLSGVTGNWALD